MPNRYVRADAISSERVNSLTWQGEVFWRRLINIVDDFGRTDAHPELLRALVFPMQLSKVSGSDVNRLLAECEEKGLIAVYEDGGKRYLQMGKWEQGRAKASKYPQPPANIREHLQTYVFNAENIGNSQPAENKGGYENSPTDANRCKQMQTNVPDTDTDTDTDTDCISLNSRARGSVPDFEQVLATAHNGGIPREVAEAFFDSCEAAGWLHKQTGKPLGNWAAALRQYNRNWKSNEQRNGHRKDSSRNAGTSNEGRAGEYAGI